MAILIEDSGIHTERGEIGYVWFAVQREDGSRFVRAVALAELAAIPVSVREEYDLLQRQWAAVRGLYNAQADYIYTAAGIFTPQHIGIVQFYGGAGVGDSREEAATIALRNLAAVKATLANYEQSRLAAPNPQWVEWYMDFVTTRSRNIMALLGHPDPRIVRRGLGKDGEIPDNTGEDLAAEQNEMLFRGLAKLREDFVFQVASDRVSRKRLAEGLVRVAQLTSNVASRQRGNLSIGFSLSIPLAMALSNATSGSQSLAESQAHSTSDGISHGWGKSHTDSYAHTVSESHSEGGSESHSWGVGHTDSAGHSDSQGYAHGVGHTDSQSDTESQSHSDTWSHTDSQSHSESNSTSHSESSSSSHSVSDGYSSNWSSSTSESVSEGVSGGESHSEGTSSATGTSTGHSQGGGASWSSGSSTSASETASSSASDSVNGSVSVGVPGVVSAGGGASHSEGTGMSVGSSSGESSSVGGSMSESFSTGTSAAEGESSSDSVSSGWSSGSSTTNTTSYGGGSSHSESYSSSHGTTDTVSHGTTDTTGSADSKGGADTKGTAHSEGSADSTSAAWSSGSADSTGKADSQSEAWSTSRTWSHTKGTSDTWGKADGKSENWGRSRSEGDAVGLATGRAISSGFGSGFSTGIVPGVSIGRSWQAEDDLAIRLTELLRQFEAQLNTASAEGGFLTTAVIFTASDQGEAAARSLVPQAFHGPTVPTPVLTIQPSGADAQDIRDHALAFLPYPGVEQDDPLGGYLFTKYATLLTPGQNAAYTAPGLFEEGTAMTVMAPIPKGMAFYPTMPGNVLIGHQYSPETGDLTNAPVLIDEARMMHTMFAGDTGWGKSVAAIMMAYESTLRWKTRTVVLDFGAGWRQVLNAPGLEGHVNILQLWPDAVRPFRWNPLQIGRQINPETQWRAFADIFGSIAKLGVKRQKQELLDALRRVYVRAGVLADDKDVRTDPEMGHVRDQEEADLTGRPVGTPLGDLTREQRQALAVLRSSRVGLSDLYDEVQYKRDNEVSSRDTMLQGVLDGILFRLNPLVQGAAAQQFAAGISATPLEDLSRPWGITVIEGGIFLDDFGKAFLLGWAGWHLYTDMVARRVHEVTNDEPLLQIYFEEANKVFGGVGDGGGDDESGGVSTSQRFADMFRDARKYKCRLHVVTQAPSLIPQDIISSCNNLVVGFLKQPKDKDIVLSALAKSEKGFRDEEWRRFLTNENIGMAIGRFPYSTSRELQQPVLLKPLMLTVPEPTDVEIAEQLGRIAL